MFAVLLCSITGCQQNGEQRYGVEGKVLFEDGSNARFGIIEFRSNSPEPVVVRSKIKKDGTFKIRTVKGSHTVIILQVIGNPRGRPKVVHKHGLEVADKYRNYTTSDLRIDVNPDGKNQFELRVDSK